MKTPMIRSRWAAIGAALAVSLGAGGIGIGYALPMSGEQAVYQPITPCRLADTRPAPDNVGPRSSPIGADETYTLSGWGTVGDCTIVSEPTALALNVTAIAPTLPTFLTLFPAAKPLPKASHLNPAPGQPPAPNAVNIDLDSNGKFSIYNKQGTVDIIIDVVGFYDDHHHDGRYYTQGAIDAQFERHMWARVESDGTLISGTPGVTSQKSTQTIDTGRYIVRFPREVTTCALVAQSNSNVINLASELVFPHDTTQLDLNDVFVYFENEAGSADDREFSVIAMC